MPELPEIETVKLQLSAVLPGKVIEKIEVRNKKTVQGDTSLVCGRKIIAVRRKAKVLIVDFEGGTSMAFHFKMSGQLIFDNDNNGETYKDRIAGGHPTADFFGKLPSSHTRVIFYMNSATMYFNDQRMFGWMKVGTTEDIEKEKFLMSLGPEPFDIEADEFKQRVSVSKRPIKLIIMEQSVISGVGNIYANDALWEAKINPQRPANLLTTDECAALLRSIVLVLREGIEYGGATAADAKYIDLHGLGGHYQDHFRTYDKEGKVCLRNDGGVIKKIVLGGRGTFFCPTCQKLDTTSPSHAAKPR
jgi:formamidopyrimidine-DNA glycosylase